MNDGRVFSVALLDLDHSKEINDVLTHDVGDSVLVEFAGLLAAATQLPAVAARNRARTATSCYPKSASMGTIFPFTKVLGKPSDSTADRLALAGGAVDALEPVDGIL